MVVIVINNIAIVDHSTAISIYRASLESYRIAGNFRWVQIFMIFMDRPASAKIKMRKFLLKSLDAFPRNFGSVKSARYTV